jgi:uncharacterized membrane protein
LNCPVCGQENSASAVFCGNPACGKALGEFRYVREELRRSARWHEKLAERFTAFIGAPYFVVLHAAWFGLWILINTGVVTIASRFDRYPFSFLSILIGIEAIFITGFILITQNRQSAFSNKRAELDYEMGVLTSRKIDELEAKLDRVLELFEKS